MITPAMQAIEDIILDSTAKAKTILLAEAAKLKPFPTVFIGYHNPEYASKEPSIAHGMLGDVDISSRGLQVETPGIIVYNSNQFWTERNYVIMMPDGMYRFSAGLFVETRDGRPINSISSVPDGGSKHEVETDYLRYARLVLSTIEELTAPKGRKK